MELKSWLKSLEIELESSHDSLNWIDFDDEDVFGKMHGNSSGSWPFLLSVAICADRGVWTVTVGWIEPDARKMPIFSRALSLRHSLEDLR